MLPVESPLKVSYNLLLKMYLDKKRDNAEKDLTYKMVKGSIDVNIMVKIDRTTRDRKGNILFEEYSDAK